MSFFFFFFIFCRFGAPDKERIFDDYFKTISVIRDQNIML